MPLFTVNITVPDGFYTDDMASVEEAICAAMADLNADRRTDDLTALGYRAETVYRNPRVSNTIAGSAHNIIQCGNVQGEVRLGGAQ